MHFAANAPQQLLSWTAVALPTPTTIVRLLAARVGVGERFVEDRRGYRDLEAIDEGFDRAHVVGVG
jgi:hypothetical protein